MSEEEVFEMLWYFLLSPNGARYQTSFDFEKNFTCENPIEGIKLTTLEFVHQRFNSTSQHLDGMLKVYDMISDLDFSNSVFPMTQEYANWETELIIQNELYRNVGLSMACVFVTMLILLGNIVSSNLAGALFCFFLPF